MPSFLEFWRDSNIVFADNSYPFENALEDALCVFKSGNNNSDIMENNAYLIIFYFDLENEYIVSKPNNSIEEIKLIDM
jgi:hypothetical protein